MSKFNLGDRVVYTPKTVDAKIVRIFSNGECVIEFDDKNLIPPQMTVPETFLALKTSPALFGDYGWTREEASARYSDTNCRKCGQEWKETWIGRTAYYDCLKCGIKKEDS